MSNVRAFVAGATGFVGRAVVPALRQADATVIAHVRPSSRSGEWRSRFGEVGATVAEVAWEPAAMTAALAAHAPTHVFCLIGTTRDRAKAEGIAGDPYMAIDYGLTKLLVDAVLASGKRPRLILLSSIGVTAKATSKYLHAHWLAEECVRQSGLPWLIAQPSFIVGPDRDDSRPAERIGAAVAGGLLAVTGLIAPKVRATYRPTSPAILAAALVRHGLAPGDSRVISGDDLR
ncbi:MAG: NAD(P)H-binding protein [Deltaproteobacteria bacterium]|nr:NAD(P)H-binding protein [Deltaproteobacteria bacterium]